MRIFSTTIRQKMRRMWRGEQGGATIEFVIWVPVFGLLLGLITDTSLIFGGQADALRVVQDANRALSIGHIKSIEEAETYVLTHVAGLSPRATVITTVDHGMINTVLTMPAADLTATGLFAGFSGLNIRVASEFMSEA